MAPAYYKSDFVKACDSGCVIFWDGVDDDAREDFGLTGKKAVMKFIAGGMDDMMLVTPSYPLSNEQWRHEKIPAPVVDAYKFTTGPKKKGYMAFYLNPINQKWFLKSFHKDDPKHFRNPLTQSLGDLFDKALKKKKSSGGNK